MALSKLASSYNLWQQNVFIFNWNEDNTSQIEKLKKTFEGYKNRVAIYNHLTELELMKITDEIFKKASFGIFNYVGVIILDNKSDDNRCVKPKTGTEVFIESSIFTPLRMNKSLRNKALLFITQKVINYKKPLQSNTETKERLQKLSQSGVGVVMSAANQFKLDANEKSINNFAESQFIDILCEEFERHLNDLPVADIFTNIQRQLSSKPLTVLVESCNKKFILGKAVDDNILRDFC